MIALVDYGAGNLQSVANILQKIDVKYKIATFGEQLRDAEKIIFPGVGHFGHMCSEIDSRKLRQAMVSQIALGVPFLGICLGMHLLFDGSSESPTDHGLGVFPGTVRKFSGGERIPHMGWNSFELTQSSKILAQEMNGSYGYFAHSYFCPVISKTVALTEHGEPFSAVVEQEKIFGVQFHPEKSADVGERIIRAFVDLRC